MEAMDNIEKLNKPGLWFVKTKQPSTELCRYVYDLAVELGVPVAVYSSASKKEIQNNVIEMIKKKCVDMASDELERNWLEQEMTEYNTHGQFWYPEEMNDYVPNGSFWRNYVFFDEFKILSFSNTFSNLYLIDNLSELSYEDDSDLLRKLLLLEREAVDYKKTIIVFVSSYEFCMDESHISNQTDTDYLEYLTCTKAKQIYGDPIPEEVMDRLRFELEVIEKNESERYFLFMQDVVYTAEKKLGALVGPGQGTTAGSLVAFCLGITKVDPLKHDLLFERFMCPDKYVDLDITLDFDEEGRGRVIELLKKKYGREYFAHVVNFIGMKVLSQQKAICESIKSTKGIDIDLNKIPLDDSKTFELFQKGNIEGIFCFDAEGMQEWLRYQHPTKFNDLVLLNVMCRPEIEDYIPQMLQRRCGKEKIEYPIPAMEKYLHESYGILVYQEQIMLLSRLIAKFSRKDSDNLRKAFCKRDQKLLAALKPWFMDGGLTNGYEENILEDIWQDWEEKGLYAYNKAHAVCYSWLGYQMAYLKAHFPEDFESIIKPM